MERYILHVDMDAFFASVEQREHPEYRGKPLIVGADPKGGKGRGVVSTCSYEAREYGVHSAMPVSQAYHLCPHAIFVPPRGELYEWVSQQIFAIFEQFTDLVEPLSIDEAFLDVTGSVRLFGDAVSIARQIKQRVREEQHLTCSIGVAPNKYLAKIASELEKPDGLVVVEADKIREFLHPLDISYLWGAGEKTQQVLRKMGINTIGDLAEFPLWVLRDKLGALGEHFYRLAHGMDDRQVVVHSDVKSVSNEHTFEKDTSDPEVIRKQLILLTEKVGYRLRKKGLKGRTIHFKLRYDDFNTITRAQTITTPTDRTQEILDIVLHLFEQNYLPGRKVRLTGVGVSGFDPKHNAQRSIFETIDARQTQLDKVQDLLVDRFGKHIVHRAESLTTKANKKNKNKKK